SLITACDAFPTARDPDVETAEIWALIAKAEDGSIHPVAAALKGFAGSVPGARLRAADVTITEIHSVVGRGVHAEIAVSGAPPERLLVGSASWIREEQLGRGGGATPAPGCEAAWGEGCEAAWEEVDSMLDDALTVVCVARGGLDGGRLRLVAAVVCVARGGLDGGRLRLVAAVGLADRVRPEAAALVETLRLRWGVRVGMLTGDNRIVALAVAREVGIHEQDTGDNRAVALAVAREVGIHEQDVHSELLPADKAAAIRGWQVCPPHSRLAVALV
ncbi:hypothetical protein T484DRAFT_1831516, partial [Baffinella frigidus]